MRRCAYLSTDNLEEFFVYDNMTAGPMAAHGWSIEEVSWRDMQHDWDQYEVVVVRSTWDYQDEPELFMASLERIDASDAQLANSLSIMRWNISKDYLKDIEGQGVAIVPTLWEETFDYDLVSSGFSKFACQELIIKPLVSANADHTYRLKPDDLPQFKDRLQDVFGKRAYMVQPFMKSVIEEGEYSLFYFNGHYSHSILKVPKSDDFRVQEEHGGQLQSVEPDEVLRSCAQRTLQALPEMPLYARLDFVRSEDTYQVMEVELIEPSLYFNMDESSPQKFADAFAERFG